MENKAEQDSLVSYSFIPSMEDKKNTNGITNQIKIQKELETSILQILNQQMYEGEIISYDLYARASAKIEKHNWI